MKKILSSLLILLLVASCSGKGGDNDVNFSVTLGNVVSGTPLSGGLFLTGTSSSGLHFSYGTMNPENISIDLPNGEWTFQALGWKSGGGSPMDGINVCGKTTANLAGGDATVNLALSTGNCNSADFASAEAFDSVANDGTFKGLDFESCLTIANVNTASGELCNNQTLSRMTGQSAAIRIALRGKSNFGSPIGDLISNCIAVSTYPSDLTGSSFSSNLKLPVNVGGSYPFPIEVQSYRDATCGTHPSSEEETDEARYIFPNGFGGDSGSESHSIVYNVGSTVSRVYWPDNYLGYPDSAFTLASIAPTIHCNGGNQCYPGDTAQLSNYPESNVKSGVWDIVGNPKWVDLHDRDESQPSSYEFVNGSETITITSLSSGSDYEIRFIDSQFGSCGAGMNSPPFIVTGNQIEIDSCNSTDNTMIVAAINAQSASLGISATMTGSGPGGWDSAHGSFKKLEFPQLLIEREFGLLTEIKHMLYGPMGAILHKNGVTDLDGVCADTGTYSETFIDSSGNSETFSVSLSAGSVIPSNHMTLSNGTAYEKRLTFSEPNGSTAVFEFNCSSGGDANGYFRTTRSDSGETEEMEVHYYTAINNKAGIEIVEYDNEGGSQVRKNWTYFQKESDTAWRFYETTLSVEHNHYARTGALGDETSNSLDVLHYTKNGVTTETNFTGTALGGENLNTSCVKLSDGTSTTCGSVTVEPTSTISGGIDGLGDDFAGAVMTLDFSTGDLNSKVPANFTGI